MARDINSMGARPDDYVVVLLSEGVAVTLELFDFQFEMVIF